MVNPKIEDLRKKAFLLYSGLQGVELVNKEVKKMGSKEDKLNEYQLKIVLNNIIKNVFIDFVGYDATKELLAKEVTHVSGYHMNIEEDQSKIHIFERIQMMKIITILLVVLFIIVALGGYYYTRSFDPADVCEAKRGDTGRDACYLTLAMSIVNVTFCDRIKTEMTRLNCYGTMGVALTSMRLCNQVPGDNPELMAIHDKCVMCIAYKLKNVSLCSDFMSPFKGVECTTQIERGQSLSC